MHPSTSFAAFKPCHTDGHDCMMFDVPLNHNKPDGYRAYVPLLRFKSTAAPTKGMVLLNPGGPGKSGVDWFTGMGKEMQRRVGENYDIVAFDPRGIGYSIPSANCNQTDPNAVGRRYELPHGPLVPFDNRYIRESTALIGEVCQSVIGGEDQAGQHMSTATVAHDLHSILEAYAASPEAANVENAALLNYIGYSYGTVIGQNFASMYPDRVGRMVLDGVVDIEDSAVGLPLRALVSTDDAFATFFIYCHLAGPDKCAFYTDSNPGDIFLRFEWILSRLDTNIANALDWANATEIENDLYMLKRSIFDALYSPKALFPGLATLLLDMETHLKAHNLSAVAQDLSGAGRPPRVIQGDDSWMSGVTCTDNSNTAYNVTDQEFIQYMNLLMQQSYIGGEVYVANWYQCVGWSIKAVETFTGAWGGKTATPILFIGNSWDVITPLMNALKGTTLFSKSEVLIVNEPGHCTANKCSEAKTRAYFQEGTMPGADNFCVGLEEGNGPFDTTLTMRMEDNGAYRSILGRLRALRLKTYRALDFS
ncbi:alpha/beta-Hydrolase [Glarea lozoyensis ATCC 20868]|uniref:Alpha/beta-Hydrolase n=1 Tax=Glarea lozoyensis (strain ATCC 20868 / MF5171) TaxID=1116229 RepID=S3DBR6_GLAL2|nr:alpha/beta-Hydrolase [Glarea lozoyensis ATCC 20868]EPE29411.1 alpha/beta-Hydrolase [Glarea lozoyensis ATCC 20868]